jgi:hypothetical protein
VCSQDNLSQLGLGLGQEGACGRGVPDLHIVICQLDPRIAGINVELGVPALDSEPVEQLEAGSRVRLDFSVLKERGESMV